MFQPVLFPYCTSQSTVPKTLNRAALGSKCLVRPRTIGGRSLKRPTTLISGPQRPFRHPSSRRFSIAQVGVVDSEDTMPTSLKADFGDEDTLFPPLPEIKSQAIKMQVFTHRSVFGRPTHVFEDHPGDLSPDNEKFEHLGDTVLGLTITSLLMEMFPGLRVGPSTKIRAMVVGNPTLAEISLRYKLPDHLYIHPAQALTLRASTSIQADVFEAFVGGLYLDQGLDTAQTWLKKLFRPYATAAYQISRHQHGLPPLPPSFSSNTSASGSTTENSIESIVSKLNLLSTTQGQAVEIRRIAPPLSSGSLTPSAADSGSVSLSPSYSATSSVATLAVTMAAAAANFSCNEPTVGHLAFFNQHLQRMNRKVEWVYDETNDTPASQSQPRPQSQSTPAAAADQSRSELEPIPGTKYRDMYLPAEVMIKGTKATPVWYVKVLVDGEFYGRGRGSTKKAARNEAAKEGLIKLGIKV